MDSSTCRCACDGRARTRQRASGCVRYAACAISTNKRLAKVRNIKLDRVERFCFYINERLS